MPAWSEALGTLSEGIADNAVPLARLKVIHVDRIIALQEHHPSRPAAERLAIEAAFRDLLEDPARHGFGPKSHYLLPAYLTLVLRNPAHWTFVHGSPAPSTFLREEIARATALPFVDPTNPFLGIFGAIGTFVEGQVESACLSFAEAARAPDFSRIVNCNLRGASTMKAFPCLSRLLDDDGRGGHGEGVSELVCEQPAPDAPVFSFTGDDIYFRAFALSIVESLCAHVSAAVTLHFHIVNYNAARSAIAVDAIRRVASRAGVSLNITTEESADTSRTYYATARYLRLESILERFGRPVIVSDMDVVFTADPLPVVREADPERVGILLSDGPYWGFLPWRQIWAGQIQVSPNAGGRLFARAVRLCARHLWREEEHLTWWTDQSALWMAREIVHRLGMSGIFERTDERHSRYLSSSERLKIEGLKRIDEIATAMASGASWNDALIRAQKGQA